MSKQHYFKKVSWKKLVIYLTIPSTLPFLSPSVYGYEAETIFNSNALFTTYGNLFQNEITGIVRAKDGQALAGVTVTVKNGGQSTSTNQDGSFSIQVPNASTVLVFSFVGYQKLEIQASQAKNVSLEPIEDEIDEIVVVGYGSQKKTNLTSAVSQVDAKVLQNRPSPTVANMLQGAAPGLVVTRNSGRPGAQGLNIAVRGETSANGSVAPLIVIDGVISSEETFVALNPNDIENMSILKDGGATAIYGAQSAGGVILVTTKRGKSGVGQISFSSNLGIQRTGAIPDRLSLIDEMNYVNLARKNAGIAEEYTEEDRKYAVEGPTFVLGSNGQWRTYNQENIIDQVIQKKYNIYNNNLQFSGGSEKITYMASLGNMTQNGMF